MTTYARDIKSIQKIVGAYVDGIYGPATTTAVKTYQKNVLRVWVDGIWGPATERAYVAFTGSILSAASKAARDATLRANVRSLTQINAAIGLMGQTEWTETTFTALKAYQTKINAFVDGIWGPATERAHISYITPRPPVVSAEARAAYDKTKAAGVRPFTSIYDIVGYAGDDWTNDSFEKVKSYQKAVGTVSDGVWGLMTEIAYKHYEAEWAAEKAGLSTALVPVVEVARHAKAAGFTGDALIYAVAVAIAESGKYNAKTDQWFCDPVARFVNTSGRYSVDRGVWQINDYYHKDVTDAMADNPSTAAKAAYRISSRGTSFRPWSTWVSGSYKRHMSTARSAVSKL